MELHEEARHTVPREVGDDLIHLFLGRGTVESQADGTVEAQYLHLRGVRHDGRADGRDPAAC
jgi:hypothetical protein